MSALRAPDRAHVPALSELQGANQASLPGLPTARRPSLVAVPILRDADRGAAATGASAGTGPTARDHQAEAPSRAGPPAGHGSRAPRSQGRGWRRRPGSRAGEAPAIEQAERRACKAAQSKPSQPGLEETSDEAFGRRRRAARGARQVTHITCRGYEGARCRRRAAAGWPSVSCSASRAAGEAA